MFKKQFTPPENLAPPSQCMTNSPVEHSMHAHMECWWEIIRVASIEMYLPCGWLQNFMSPYANQIKNSNIEWNIYIPLCEKKWSPNFCWKTNGYRLLHSPKTLLEFSVMNRGI